MPDLLTLLLIAAVLLGVAYAAWALSRDALTAPPRNDSAYQRGMNALLAGDRDQALDAFTRSVQEDSDNVDAYIHLGNLLREKGEVDRAIHLHRELTVRSGLSPAQDRAVRQSLVLDWIAAGRAADALAEARSLWDLDRKDESALRLLLRALESSGAWDEAYSIRTELSRMSGDRDGAGLARYRAGIGEVYFREGKLEEAKHHFKAAVKLRREEPSALLRLGDIYYEAHHTERATVFWKALAEAHPGLSHLVLERLETAYFEKGRFSEMERTYEEMLARNPRDTRILVALGRMHVKKGELAEASRAVNEALQIDPEWIPARLLRVEIHRSRGEVDRAVDEMGRILRSAGTGEVYSCSGCGNRSEEYWNRCPRCAAWMPEA